MTTGRPGKISWWKLLAPFVIALVAYFASLPWQAQQQNEALTYWIAAAVGVFVLGYSVFVASHVRRHMDEVQVAGDHFATERGMALGSFAAVLMMFTPASDVFVGLANMVGDLESPDQAVGIGVWLGILLVSIFQALAIIVVKIWWTRRVIGPQA